MLLILFPKIVNFNKKRKQSDLYSFQGAFTLVKTLLANGYSESISII